MTTPTVPRISVVVGVQKAVANLPAILDALRPGLANGDAEVLLCHPAEERLGPDLAAVPGLRAVAGRTGALIPELWRDGILAARAPAVAILSAHCVPAPAWLETALALDLDARVAYGGLIVNDPGSDTAGAAIHYLRYAAFARSEGRRTVTEIAADNAVYRRSAILACPDLLDAGFWEPAFHARFRARGETLELRPDLVVTHVNRYRPGQFMRQRRLHGRNFGLARARAAAGPGRALLLLASPAAFPVFALKQTRAILRDPQLRRGFLGAAPWFYLFMAAWSFGEMQGYAAGLGARR